jgi:hypothetical protein
MDDGELLGASSDGEGVDGDRHDEGISRVWSTRSIASWRDAEEWLERL